MPIASFADIVEDDAPANVARLADIVEAAPAPRPRVEDILRIRPVASHDTTIVDPETSISKPGELERQMAWSLSPARDRAAKRMGQPAVNTPAPEPLDPAAEAWKRITPGVTQMQPAPPLEEFAKVPIVSGPAVGIAQAAKGVTQLGRAATSTTLPAALPPARTGAEAWQRATPAVTQTQPTAPLTPQTMAAGSDVLEGGFKILEPLLLVAGIAEPFALLTSLVAGYGAAKATEVIATKAQLDPEATRLLSNVAAAVGASAAPGAVRTGLKDAAAWGRERTAARDARRTAARTIRPDPTDIVTQPVREPAGALPAAPEPVPPTEVTAGATPPSAGTARLADIVAVGAPAAAPTTELGIPSQVSSPDPAVALAAAKAGVTELVDQLPKGPDATPQAVPASPILESTPSPAPIDAARPSAPLPETAVTPAAEPSGVAKLEDIVEVAPPVTPGVTLETPDGQARPVDAGAAPQIQASDDAARPGAPPEGQAVVGSRGRSAEGPRLSKVRQHEIHLITQVTQDAVDRGFTGDRAALTKELETRAAAMREIKAEVDAAGGTGNALIRELVKAGGLAIKAETGQQGELRWLKESGLGTRWGLFSSKRKGLTLDGAVEYLRQDPRFQHIEDVTDLVDELTDVAQGEGALGDLTARELGAVGENWWEHLVPSEASSATQRGEPGPTHVVYHGTDTDFDRFEHSEDIGFHFGSRETADERLRQGEFQARRIVAAKLAIKRALRLPDQHTWDPRNVLNALEEAGVLTAEEADAIDLVDRETIAPYLERAGYDGIVYANATEGGGDSYIAIRPDQIEIVGREKLESGTAHVDDIVDVLETGERQERLPEAGAVRETEVATPEFEAPFSLTSEAHDAGSVQTGLRFDAPAQTPAPKRGGGGEASIGAVGDHAPGRPAPLPKPDDRRLFPSTPSGTATSAHPVQFPELVDLARELQHVPKVRKSLGKALGLFRHARGIELRADLFQEGGEYQVAATLAHEIGHLVDYLPHRTLKRGNLLGRLFSLRDFLKHTFTADDGAIIENKVIRAELKALSDKWRPWDEAKSSASFKKYRNSGKEQYADALSVLLNDPALLKHDAPTFYKEFFNALDRKPDVRDAYFSLQEVLSGTPEELVARRRAGVRRMMEEGDVKALELEQRRLADLKQRGKDLWFRMKTQLVDRNYAVIDRVNNLPAGVRLADDENPIYLLEERSYMGAQLKAFTEKNFAPVFSDVSKADIPWNAFGEALMYERIIAGDRSEVANPRGLSPESAPALLAALKQELGAERVKVLEPAMTTFRGIIKHVAEDAYQAGLYTEELYKQMQENPAYVTFQVIDHLESGVTSRVYRQVGTLKDIVNPADASILKTLVTIRATEHQKIKRSVFEFLEHHYGHDIKPAKTVWSGKGHRPIESKDPDERLVTYFEKGKLVGKYVDPYIADALENASIGQNLAVVSILRTINSGVFRPLFTTFNLGFQGFNAARDFARFWKNVPTMSVGRALLRYYQAVPVARARAFGLPAHPTKAQLDAYRTLLDAEEKKMLSVTFNDLINGRQVEDTQIEDILARTGVGGFKAPERSKWVKPLVKVLDTIRETGDFIETLPKAAALYEFKGAGPISAMSAEQRSYIRRKVGSPDFLAGGTAKPITNEVFLFSNAITQAVRSDLEVATEPKTRSGFWWKTATSNLLPKLLLAAGLAGLFGEAVKRLLGRTSEYDRTNYIVVPLGEDDKGNTIYLRVPQDDSGRLIGGLFWKVLRLARGETDVVETIAQVADYSSGQFPNVAPTLQTIGAALQFAAGQNPYDAFRGRNVFTDDEWKARDWRTAKKFVGWEFQQLGGGIVWKFYPGEPRPRELTEAQKILELPVVSNIAGRFVRITNYGETETFRAAAADVAKGEARSRMAEREAVNDAIRSYQQLPSPEQTAGRRWQLARQVADKVYADESAAERGRRTNLIVKKLSLGLVRGEADPLADSVLAATSNDQKVAVLREARKRMGEAAFATWLKDAVIHDVVSVSVRNALRRPTVEDGLRKPATPADRAR